MAKHIHQYKRVKVKDSTVYRCILPNCAHYIGKAFIINRVAKCPYCGNEYLITRELARRETLHCQNCTKGKVKNEDVVDFLGSIKEVTE